MSIQAQFRVLRWLFRTFFSAVGVFLIWCAVADPAARTPVFVQLPGFALLIAVTEWLLRGAETMTSIKAWIAREIAGLGSGARFFESDFQHDAIVVYVLPVGVGEPCGLVTLRSPQGDAPRLAALASKQLEPPGSEVTVQVIRMSPDGTSTARVVRGRVTAVHLRPAFGSTERPILDLHVLPTARRMIARGASCTYVVERTIEGDEVVAHVTYCPTLEAGRTELERA